MTYRELLELYRQGKLAEEQAENVKKDIERQEAISDYLLDEGEVEAGAFDFDGGEPVPAADDTSAEFAKMVNSSIRRAFRKLGITVFVVTLIVVLFIQFALPNIVSSRYYNPSKVLVEGDGTVGRTQLGLDMAVYTELLYPLDYRRYAEVDSRGYGNYDICIRKDYGHGNQKIRDVIGKIEKGKITLYNEDFQAPYGNSFKWNEVTSRSPGWDTETPITDFSSIYERYGDTAAEAREYCRDIIETENDGDTFICYVTPTYQMKYEDFMEFVEKNPWAAQGWCAVRTGDWQEHPSYGFQYEAFCSQDWEWDKEKYPNLLLPSDVKKWDEEKEAMKSEEFAMTHFLSLLNYLNDNQEFAKMMFETDRVDYSETIENVKKQGLIVYGFAVIATKDQALKMLDCEDLFYVNAVPLD